MLYLSRKHFQESFDEHYKANVKNLRCNSIMLLRTMTRRFSVGCLMFWQNDGFMVWRETKVAIAWLAPSVLSSLLYAPMPVSCPVSSSPAHATHWILDQPNATRYQTWSWKLWNDWTHNCGSSLMTGYSSIPYSVITGRIIMWFLEVKWVRVLLPWAVSCSMCW